MFGKLKLSGVGRWNFQAVVTAILEANSVIQNMKRLGRSAAADYQMIIPFLSETIMCSVEY